VRAAAYTGERLPTLNELYRPFVVFPVVTQANAELKNERLIGFEAGLELEASDTVRLSLTAFDNRVKDAIANVTLATNLRQRQNLPAIDAQGLETSLSARAGPFSIDGSLSYTNATIDGAGASRDLDGNRPPQVPRWAGSATVKWRPGPGWEFAATLRHVGAQFEDDLETDRLPRATTIGGFIRVPIANRLALVLRGENLTGKDVITRNAAGSVDLGAPRTVWAGLRYGD
jgi:outer membrane receptor protein involved in Fe transport